MPKLTPAQRTDELVEQLLCEGLVDLADRNQVRELILEALAEQAVQMRGVEVEPIKTK